MKLGVLTGYRDTRKVQDSGFDTHLSTPVDLERLRQLLAATAREVTP